MTKEQPNGFCRLAHRGALRISGSDVKSWLQGLVSGNVEAAGSTRAIYSALLTPQGKFLFDMFIVGTMDGSLILDVEQARMADLAKRLAMYRLRAKIMIEPAPDLAVFALLGDATQKAGLGSDSGSATALASGAAFVDPRLPALGARLIAPEAAAHDAFTGLGIKAIDPTDYTRLRIGLGVADGSMDIEIDKGLLLEHGFEELNGVDFRKGCYIGQELTARTKYRGLVKKRLCIVRAETDLPAAGTLITLHGEEAGVLRSGLGRDGLALMRLEKLDEAHAAGMALTADHVAISVALPAYVKSGTSRHDLQEVEDKKSDQKGDQA